jgi:hypothetical protein
MTAVWETGLRKTKEHLFETTVDPVLPEVLHVIGQQKASQGGKVAVILKKNILSFSPITSAN